MSLIPAKELERLYLELGRALWHLQYVEDALNALLTVKRDIGGPGRVTDAEARAMLAKQLSATFGRALTQATNCALLPEEELRRLDSLKGERNWLAHRIQRTAGDWVLTASGRLRLVERIERITTESKAALASINAEMTRFVESSGHEVVSLPRVAALLEADGASAA